MRTNLLIVVIAVLSLFAGMRTHESLRGLGNQVNSAIQKSVYPHPRLTELNGQIVSLKKWSGNKLLVNFWASWCGPCREEMPLLSDVQDQWSTHNLQVIGIALDDPEEVMAYLKETPVSYTILISSEETINWMETLGNKANALPFTILLDEEGKLLTTFVGKLDKKTLLEWIQTYL